MLLPEVTLGLRTGKSPGARPPLFAQGKCSLPLGPPSPLSRQTEAPPTQLPKRMSRCLGDLKWRQNQAARNSGGKWVKLGVSGKVGLPWDSSWGAYVALLCFDCVDFPTFLNLRFSSVKWG